MALILEFIISWIAVALTAWLLPGVEVDWLWTAIVVGIVFAIINLIIGWVARFLTAPLNFLTLGLISFLITGLMVLLTGNLVDGFVVSGYIPALAFALILGLIRSLFGMNAIRD
jgi:putative membrane protein